MKPATSLPWKISGLGYICSDQRVVSSTEYMPSHHSKYSPQAEDAAYIVHACNAYPRLVELVREYSEEYGHGKFLDLLRELGELS